MQPDAAQPRELLTGETHLAHQAMRALRTTYESDERFVEYVDGVLRPAGYRLLGAFSPDRESAVAVAGFRVGDNLAWGHYLYVDDLSTAPEARRQGLAGALLEWLIEEGSPRRSRSWIYAPGQCRPRAPAAPALVRAPRDGWR